MSIFAPSIVDYSLTPVSIFGGRRSRTGLTTLTQGKRKGSGLTFGAGSIRRRACWCEIPEWRASVPLQMLPPVQQPRA